MTTILIPLYEGVTHRDFTGPHQFPSTVPRGGGRRRVTRWRAHRFAWPEVRRPRGSRKDRPVLHHSGRAPRSVTAFRIQSGRSLACAYLVARDAGSQYPGQRTQPGRHRDATTSARRQITGKSAGGQRQDRRAGPIRTAPPRAQNCSRRTVPGQRRLSIYSSGGVGGRWRSLSDLTDLSVLPDSTKPKVARVHVV